MGALAKVLTAVGLATLLLLSYLTGIRAAFILAYALILLVAWAWAWPHLAARGIGLERRIQSGTASVGESFTETLEVWKAGWVPTPWLEVVDMSDIPGYQAGRIVSLNRGPVRWTARGTYRLRGWQTFGPTLLRVAEPFGMFTREVRNDEQNRILVHPRVHPLPQVVLPSTQHAGETTRHGAWADYPPETGGVRDYTPGDAYGRIHWPLSVKHDHLMSKTFEQPLTTDLWIALDLARNAHWGNGEGSTLELAISLAASLVVQVGQLGRLVGLMANDRRGTALEPHRAERDGRAVMDYLSVAGADGEVPLAQALAWDRIRRVPHRGLAVITASPDPSWVHAVQAARQRGSSLIVFYIDAASFGAPARAASLDLGSEVDLYVIRRGDDLSRLRRTRDVATLA
ncbi:MAG TPA: DUF58 domain-containing protein [Candidatus Acidoferrales bacterium]|nr:DUF58 domain-containing protein [Candidatus Acidoferrales bacterium]